MLTGCFPGASAGTKASSKGKGASGSRYRGRGTGKGEGKPDSRRPSLAKSRQTSSGPMKRGCCVARDAVMVISRQIVQITDHVTKITHISNVRFGSFVGLVHDQSTTLITKPGTPRAEVSVDGESSSILFSLGLMDLFLLSLFCSSWCPHRRANPVLKSCTTRTKNSQQASTPQCVLTTDSGFGSKIFHASVNRPILNLRKASRSF